VPRDAGRGWDFEDVRDHYLRELLGVDPLRLRYADPERYLQLSRLASAEVMAAAMQEWRRAGSSCRGALVWFWRDLWPGAGWGLVDAGGLPKSPYYALRRVCAPVALLLTDEGLNGLALHVVNDGAQALPVRVQLALYRRGELLVASGEAAGTVPARSGASWRGDALLGRFTDLAHSYRFGPPGHELAVASLLEAGTGALLGRAFHCPDPAALTALGDPGLSGIATPLAEGGYEVEVRTRKFAYGVWLEARGFVADDNHFHLAPGDTRRLRLRPRRADARLQGWLHCLGSDSPARLRMAGAGGAAA
jgi:beta-mannosidase